MPFPVLPSFLLKKNTESFDNVTLCYKIASDPQLQSILDQAEADVNYQSMVKAIQQGKCLRNLPDDHPLHCVASVTDNLSIHEDYLIILDNSRIFVPKAARSEVLQLLHRSHSGVTKTRLAARKLYFWPGINNDIALMVNNCQECQRLLPTQQQQPLVQTVAKFPMEQVGVDLFENGGHHYICMIDRFSTMPFCKRLKSLSTRAYSITFNSGS